MTGKDNIAIKYALEHMLAGDDVALEQPDITGATKFVYPVIDRNGDSFTFYAYTRKTRKKKVFLTDAGLILKTLNKSGLEVAMNLLQSMLRTYQLTLTQDGCVVEQTDRPIGERVMALFQAWAAADGVLRTWTRPEDPK